MIVSETSNGQSMCVMASGQNPFCMQKHDPTISQIFLSYFWRVFEIWSSCVPSSPRRRRHRASDSMHFAHTLGPLKLWSKCCKKTKKELDYSSYIFAKTFWIGLCVYLQGPAYLLTHFDGKLKSKNQQMLIQILIGSQICN